MESAKVIRRPRESLGEPLGFGGFGASGPQILRSVQVFSLGNELAVFSSRLRNVLSLLVCLHLLVSTELKLNNAVSCGAR